ncbi:MAG TPA: methionyl-tRNA formyltransferase [Bacteroidales bacterium]|nr:methionyl-tRNA formyltransferase [Bacteroidales bacterium]HOK74548.1 methionyl-tRNA formyltransferase [Bacteroidales bacterium]HOM41505.1 methionyl-tRNA formyltransferase [Bacteroidales bacterium]HOU03546.1 methionyl-tRNA formyltransferase [Bacteroidales bacterium]HPP92698.1 methionyl-tRNA formyltransferase [Bacteroidales bacterium]
MKNLRIVFMGTPEFAVATLGSLLMNGFNVVGVVTTPDKPAGRGRKLKKSPVKEFAEFSYLPVLQPENLEDPSFIDELKKLNPDVIIVVAFRKLPEAVWKIPPMGTINLHASLLPHYRGAAPINHAIINGETRTGLTTFLINDKIDTGEILLREEVQIFPYENAGDLKARMMKLGARLVIKTLEGLVNKTIIPVPQSQFLKPGEKPKPAPKITPADCIIDWQKDAVSIHNLIRGLAPDPCARSFFKGKDGVLLFKIYESKPEEENHSYIPGEIISDGKEYLRIACGKGILSVCTIQLEGKKKMSVTDFLRGFKIKDYRILPNPPA